MRLLVSILALLLLQINHKKIVMNIHYVKKKRPFWNPTRSNKITSWYDFSLLTQSNNQSLSNTYINDLTGNDKIYVNSVMSSYPVVCKTNEINGLSCISAPTFSGQGTQDQRSSYTHWINSSYTTDPPVSNYTAPTALHNKSDCYVIFVAYPYSLSRGITQGMFLSSRVGENVYPRLHASLDTNNKFRVCTERTNVVGNGKVVTSTNAITSTSPHIFSCRLNFTSGYCEIYINGSSEGSVNYASSGNSTWGSNYNGHGFLGGIGTNPRSNGLHGSMGEIICMSISSSNLDSTEINKLEGYIAHKWGLSSSLPNDHTYKSKHPLV